MRCAARMGTASLSGAWVVPDAAAGTYTWQGPQPELLPLVYKSGGLGSYATLTVSDLFVVFLLNLRRFLSKKIIYCVKSWCLNHATERPENFESAQKRPYFAHFRGVGYVGH